MLHLSNCLLLLCWAQGPSGFDYLMNFKQLLSSLSLHHRNRSAPWGSHGFNKLHTQPFVCVCICVWGCTHKSISDRKVGKWSRKWQSCMIRGEFIITGLCVHVNVCVCKREGAKLYQQFQLQSPVWTTQQGNHRDGILRIIQTHTYTLMNLSFTFSA